MEPFGQWIKTRRRRMGLGLHRCAMYAYIGGEGLRLIETGKTDPSSCKAATLYGLARVLKLDVEEVIERAAQTNPKLMEWLEREWPDKRNW